MSSLAIQLLESRMFPSVVARRISRVGESSWKRGGTEEGRLGPLGILVYRSGECGV